MRIAHVVSTFPPYHGGQGNVAREIAERTAARGHEVEVVTPGRVDGGRLTVDGDRIDRSQPATINHQLSTPQPWLRFGNAAWCPTIARMLERLQPDIVHLHWPFIGGVMPALAWRHEDAHPFNYSPIRTNRRMEKTRRRLVVQYHMDLIADGWRGVVFAEYQRRALPRLVRAADRLVVSSLDYARHGALAPFVERLEDRIAEIPLGVDVERFASQEQPLPPSPPSPRCEEGGEGGTGRSRISARSESGISILFVGGLDRAHAFKGVPVLLEALAQIPAVRLRIVGDGDLRPQYEQRARALGIADRTEFLGAVSDADLPNVYRGASVLVLPSVSRSEAFGVVLLEAMASGIPVITADLPGVRTVVVDGETGFLVPPGDAGALAARIADLAADPKRTAHMGAMASARVFERYGWERVVRAWQCVYDGLV